MMDQNDELLLDSAKEDVLRVTPRDSILQWCCVYTRPRHEKAVARTCLDLGADFYLPLKRVTHHYKSGRKVYWLPLFSSYIFCCADPDQRIELSRRERVLSIINVVDEGRFIDELLQIFRSLQVSSDLAPVPYLASGQRVEIVRGPFRGIKGVVETVKGQYRVMLTATLMNQSVPLEVDAGDVEPLE